MSTFVADQIRARLEILRHACAVARIAVRDAFRGKWGDGKYWQDRQAEAQIERPKDVITADKALSDFIAEHRPIMGAEWPGTDHGRLCWAPYCGGYPIDQHYCQREENHEGHHADENGAWPKNVSSDREWHDLKKTCAHVSRGPNKDGVIACRDCGFAIPPES